MKKFLIISLLLGLIGSLNLVASASHHHDVITKERATEVAQAFIDRYLPEYTIDGVEKEDGGKIYLVTMTRRNGAKLHVKVHGHDGKVLSLYP